MILLVCGNQTKSKAQVAMDKQNKRRLERGSAQIRNPRDRQSGEQDCKARPQKYVSKLHRIQADPWSNTGKKLGIKKKIKFKKIFLEFNILLAKFTTVFHLSVSSNATQKSSFPVFNIRIMMRRNK